MDKIDIVIMSPKIFKKTTENFREVSPFPLYKLQNAVASQENKVTMFGNTCAILGMNNGKSTYLGHFAPECKTWSFKENLDYIVQKFKDETGELFAIVTGGYDYRASAPVKNQASKSFEQVAEIGEILDKNKAELTMICGKLNPVFTDNLAVTENQFILSHTPKINGSIPTQNLKPNLPLEKMEDFLSNEYSIVEINPLHSINYIG